MLEERFKYYFDKEDDMNSIEERGNCTKAYIQLVKMKVEQTSQVLVVGNILWRGTESLVLFVNVYLDDMNLMLEDIKLFECSWAQANLHKVRMPA